MEERVCCVMVIGLEIRNGEQSSRFGQVYLQAI